MPRKVGVIRHSDRIETERRIVLDADDVRLDRNQLAQEPIVVSVHIDGKHTERRKPGLDEPDIVEGQEFVLCPDAVVEERACVSHLRSISVDQQGIAFIGSGLTATQAAALSSACTAYLSAIGGL